MIYALISLAILCFTGVLVWRLRRADRIFDAARTGREQVVLRDDALAAAARVAQAALTDISQREQDPGVAVQRACYLLDDALVGYPELGQIPAQASTPNGESARRVIRWSGQ